MRIYLERELEVVDIPLETRGDYLASLIRIELPVVVLDRIAGNIPPVGLKLDAAIRSLRDLADSDAEIFQLVDIVHEALPAFVTKPVQLIAV